MILVAGTGRCGSSAVAKFLHENGINMGPALVPGNESNPDGHYEDVDFRNLNQWRIDGKITPQSWRRGIEYLASIRDEPWGFKDPRSAHFIAEYLNLKPQVIRVRRDLCRCIESCVRWYGWPREQAAELMKFREDMLDHYLPDCFTFDIEQGDWEGLKEWLIL